MIDLHTHTKFSDGNMSPEELVDLAMNIGLSAIAITDHDVIDGIQPALNYIKNNNIDIRIIPGIEISCDEPDSGFKEVHVIGLLIDHENKDLIKFCNGLKESRIEQKMMMIRNLQKIGFDITYEDIKETVGASFGRPHIARFLVDKYPDKFITIKDVFDRYLGMNKPAYVHRKDKCSIKQAIKIIKVSGGISILAHPGVYGKEDSLELIRIFKNLGGQGIETYYPYHATCPDLKIDANENNNLIRFYRNKALLFGLLESGGSDFHGENRNTISDISVPDNLLDNFR